jgi:hypothetical protein
MMRHLIIDEWILAALGGIWLLTVVHIIFSICRNSRENGTTTLSYGPVRQPARLCDTYLLCPLTTCSKLHKKSLDS